MTAQEFPQDADEQSPLLPNGRASIDARGRHKATPLPRMQLFHVMLLQLVEPVSSQCIYPFLNQLIGELPITGGDPRKIGYYAGIIQSCFFATEAVFTLHWSMLSDRIGRKPVLLIGIAGTCLSMLLFGLSKTLLHLILSRCLVGFLNGNTGVMKSLVGDITDSSNIARVFAFMPIVWCAGATLGPLMGGQLARPHDRWPTTFSHEFWVQYPYFLPCAGSAIIGFLVFLNTLLFLKEPSGNRSRTPSTPDMEVPLKELEGPLPVREVIKRWPVLISVGNYGILALLEIALAAIQPLFFATPISLGGLGFTPATIGLIMGTFGIMNGVFQSLFFAQLSDILGPKRMFIIGMAQFPIIYALFPILNTIARESGLTTTVWALIGLQLVLMVFMDCAYGCIFMFITTSAPNRRSLGTTNGIGQLLASIVRAIGPASFTSLFAISLERKWLGGFAVYLILGIASVLALHICNLLPSDLWPDEDES